MDFGSGLSINALVGLPAWQIATLQLPKGEVFEQVGRAASILTEAGMTRWSLIEIWGDGHTVWQDRPGRTALISPTGQLIRPGDY